MNKEKEPLLSAEEFLINKINHVHTSMAMESYAKYHTEWYLNKVKEVVDNNCCDNQQLRYDKHSISIDDKQGSYKDLSFSFCENCGHTFNVDFS